MSKMDVVEIWNELHRMPEPGMKEFKTGDFLADALEKLGYEVTRGVGKTGVVGVVRGNEPGPVVMLRADMDALPFKNEDGSIEYVHACGHDSHSAMVLTAAAELADKVKKGTLKILFQPAEETLEGALAVMKDGAIDDVDIALGLHVRPVQDIPAGTCCAAVRHSASTFLCVEIEGKSAHAARPHLGVNCAEAAALITNAICAIKMNPALTWSCKVTSISAVSSASNIIPDRGELVLDVRAQTNELMDELLEKYGERSKAQRQASEPKRRSNSRAALFRQPSTTKISSPRWRKPSRKSSERTNWLPTAVAAEKTSTTSSRPSLI